MPASAVSESAMTVNAGAAIGVGILIGIVTGILTILLIRTVVNARQGDDANPVQDVLTIGGELLGLPVFWFGGPWLGQKLMGEIGLTQNAGYYILSLAVVYAVLVLVPAMPALGRLMGVKVEGGAP